MDAPPKAAGTPDFSDSKTAFAWKSTPRLYESYLVFKSLGMPRLVDWGTRMITGALRLHLPITPLIKHSIFKQFCGGTTLEECVPVVEAMYAYGVSSILDYSVEAAVDEKALDEVAAETKRTIDFANKNAGVLMSVFKMTGLIDPMLLEKVSQGDELIDTEQQAWNRGVARVQDVCAYAATSGVPVLIDAEESWLQQAIDDLAILMMRRHNREGRCWVYNTLQMYRHDRLAYLQQWVPVARAEGFIYGVKLVRGAYMEKERQRAKELKLPDPIQPNKQATDRDYDAALRFCIEHIDHVALFAGTHNEASTLLLTRLMQQNGLAANDPRITFSQLYGMSEQLSFNLGRHGYRAAKYLPYGPVKSVLPYLFRRAAENTSIQGQSGRELELIGRELARRKEQP